MEELVGLHAQVIGIVDIEETRAGTIDAAADAICAQQTVGTRESVRRPPAACADCGIILVSVDNLVETIGRAQLVVCALVGGVDVLGEFVARVEHGLHAGSSLTILALLHVNRGEQHGGSILAYAVAVLIEFLCGQQVYSLFEVALNLCVDSRDIRLGHLIGSGVVTCRSDEQGHTAEILNEREVVECAEEISLTLSRVACVGGHVNIVCR